MNNIKNDINLTAKKTEKSSVDLNKKLHIDTNNSLNKQNIIDDKSKLPYEQRSGFDMPLKKDEIKKSESNIAKIQPVKKNLNNVESSKNTIQNKELNKVFDGVKKTESIKIEPVKLTPIIDKNNSASNLIKKEADKDSDLLKNPFASVSSDSKKELIKEISKVNANDNKNSLPIKNPFGTSNVEPKKEDVKESSKLSVDNKEKSTISNLLSKSLDVKNEMPKVSGVSENKVKKEDEKEPSKLSSNSSKKDVNSISNLISNTTPNVKNNVKEPTKPLIANDKDNKDIPVISETPFSISPGAVKKDSMKEISKLNVDNKGKTAINNTLSKESLGVKKEEKPLSKVNDVDLKQPKKEDSLPIKNPFAPSSVEVKKEVIKEQSKLNANDNIVKKEDTSLLKSLFGTSLNNRKDDKEQSKTSVDNNIKKDKDILNNLLEVDPLNNKKEEGNVNSNKNIVDGKVTNISGSTILKNEPKKSSADFVDMVLDEKIDNIKSNTNSFGIGYVTKVKDFILEVSGLDDVSFFEKVEIKGKAIGYVTAIKSNKVIVAILKEEKNILVGDVVTQTNEEFKGAFSETAFGRVIDIFGNDKLVNKKFEQLFKLPVETPNISIMERSSVSRPLETGIIGIDFIYPIGKGQRQLIIGDKKIGKTQICLDTIVNQRDKDMLCIYIAIGKTKKEVKEIFYELTRKGAIQNTIILAAFNDEKPPVLSLTPYFGLSIAQYYLEKKKDVLVVIDDLKRHADAYREISLISGKTPGRDAYPSDIFYEHSRLLEKGCQHKNGGSITILPIVETRGGDITDYISTNIISITDGQIVLSEKSFKKGEKPAINYGLSVSRLGGAVQTPNAKKMGATIRRKLLSYLETREVYELANFDEMSPELQEKMKSGKKILELLTQYKFSPLTESEIIERFKFINEENL